MKIAGNDPFVGFNNPHVVAEGKTPHNAYESACAKIIIKPWLESKP